MNREAYLTEAAAKLRHDFTAAGYTVPDLLVSVGFPSRSATSRKARRIGECWDGSCSASGQPQIYISPTLGTAAEALATLVHEMVHAAVGSNAGHKGSFRRCAVALGLTGKMTATTAGEQLTSRLNDLSGSLGPYPHPALAVQSKERKGSRLLKAQCQKCGYIVRVTRQWLDTTGPPLCPCNKESMQEE